MMNEPVTSSDYDGELGPSCKFIRIASNSVANYETPYG